MFVIINADILAVAGSHEMTIELGRIVTMHKRLASEMLYTFTLDNGISITLPQSKIFRRAVPAKVGP